MKSFYFIAWNKLKFASKRDRIDILNAECWMQLARWHIAQPIYRLVRINSMGRWIRTEPICQAVWDHRPPQWQRQRWRQWLPLIITVASITMPRYRQPILATIYSYMVSVIQPLYHHHRRPIWMQPIPTIILDSFHVVDYIINNNSSKIRQHEPICSLQSAHWIGHHSMSRQAHIMLLTYFKRNRN